MPLQDLPIQRKLMVVILLISGVVMLLTCTAFVAYEVISLRTGMVRAMNTRAEIIAANVEGSLAFVVPKDATDVLSALKKDPRVLVACVYDNEGNIFAQYPADAPPDSFPPVGGAPHHFGPSYLAVFCPVIQNERMLGTVYLKTDLSDLAERYRVFALLAGGILLASALVAYLLSQALQKQISRPILGLAKTARAVSERGDYSVRAAKESNDEVGVLTDAFNQMLTQIHKQNNALSESEERVRAVFNSALTAVVVIDANSRVTDWNAQAENLFGWSRQEAIGKDLDLTIIPERYREAHRRGLGRFLKTGEGPVLNRPIQLNALRRDGSEFPVELSISPMKAGDSISFCGFITDITERKRMEEVRMRMEAIVQSSDDAIISKTLKGTITTWNPGAQKLFGYTEHEAIGKPMLMIFPPEREAEEADILARISNGETVDHFETVRVRKDGHQVDVSVSISPIRDNEGKIIGASKIARDITDQKQAAKQEAAFSKLAQSLSATDSATAAAHTIAQVADELLGWDACSLDAYMADQDLIHPVINLDTVDGKRVDVPPAYVGQTPSAMIRRVLEKGAQLVLRKAPFDFSSEAVPFGNTGHPSASLMYVPIRRGETVIGILSIQSYTPAAYNEKALTTLQTLADQCGGALERVRAEENLRQLNEELEQRVRQRTAQFEAANKELEAFSYSVSHDLRAPLRHIDGFVDLLKKSAADQLNGGGQRYLQIIADAARQMGTLIDNLLVFSRMGRTELRWGEVDLNALVKETLAGLETELAGRNIVWKIPPLPQVQADAPMLKQVFANLIGNAVKYTRKRDTAEIEIGCAEESATEFVFFVRDNGVGFDMQYVEKLFGVFQRLHRAEEFEGTGIGLANVRRIIHRHGGRTWAEGKVDAGATVYFTLPKSIKV